MTKVIHIKKLVTSKLYTKLPSDALKAILYLLNYPSAKSTIGDLKLLGIDMDVIHQLVENDIIIIPKKLKDSSKVKLIKDNIDFVVNGRLSNRKKLIRKDVPKQVKDSFFLFSTIFTKVYKARFSKNFPMRYISGNSFPHHNVFDNFLRFRTNLINQGGIRDKEIATLFERYAEFLVKDSFYSKRLTHYFLLTCQATITTFLEDDIITTRSREIYGD